MLFTWLCIPGLHMVIQLRAPRWQGSEHHYGNIPQASICTDQRSAVHKAISQQHNMQIPAFAQLWESNTLIHTLQLCNRSTWLVCHRYLELYYTMLCTYTGKNSNINSYSLMIFPSSLLPWFFTISKRCEIECYCFVWKLKFLFCPSFITSITTVFTQ